MGDFGYWRFFAYLSLFVFFMCALVMGNNFILLYLGWEGVGLASYLLIGYYYPRPSAVAAAKKAFITNRVGDFGLAIGIFLIYLNFGSDGLQYSHLFEYLKAHDWVHLTSSQQLALYWIPLCLMLGAFGKSAQFPLHVWLPDAMEGPTPVSALIHAATMVTAGIYLVARCMPIFTAIPEGQPGHLYALHMIACVGGFTAFMAASMALCQYDLKRIWAYSTLSQLGYMFLGLGVGATSAGVFHVFTHAWFKALLFLSAGSVMHAMGGELDIRKMSGIKKVMPITRIVMLIGCLALAGIPPFAGFFSKDEILGAALNATDGPGRALGVLGLLVAFMTAYYTFRLYFRVFEGPLVLPENAGGHEASAFAIEEAHGDHVHGAHGADASHGHDAHAHGTPSDGSPLMWVPLVILAIGAVAAGLVGVDFHEITRGENGWIHHLLANVFGEAHEASAPQISHVAMMGMSFAIAAAGIAVSYYFHLANRKAAEGVGTKLQPLVNFLYNRWYIDAVYNLFITTGLWIVGKILAFIDQWVVDSLVNLVGFFPQLLGYLLKPFQRGVLQRYAAYMVAGTAAVIFGVLYWSSIRDFLELRGWL